MRSVTASKVTVATRTFSPTGCASRAIPVSHTSPTFSGSSVSGDTGAMLIFFWSNKST